jgi:hypothetical protein
MSKTLTPEQLTTLRSVPLLDMPNKLKLALALVGARQTEVVGETGLTASNLSDLVNGKYTNVTIRCFAVEVLPLPVLPRTARCCDRISFGIVMVS